jgi:hypothetical protein
VPPVALLLLLPLLLLPLLLLPLLLLLFSSLLLCNIHRNTFSVLLPQISSSLSLSPSQAGAIQVQWVGGGVCVDTWQPLVWVVVVGEGGAMCKATARGRAGGQW